MSRDAARRSRLRLGNTGGVERTSDLLRRVLEARGWRVEIVAPDEHPAALGEPHAAFRRSGRRAG